MNRREPHTRRVQRPRTPWKPRISWRERPRPAATQTLHGAIVLAGWGTAGGWLIVAAGSRASRGGRRSRGRSAGWCGSKRAPGQPYAGNGMRGTLDSHGSATLAWCEAYHGSRAESTLNASGGLSRQLRGAKPDDKAVVKGLKLLAATKP